MSSVKIEGTEPIEEDTLGDFAAFDKCFPSSPFGNESTLGQLSGHNSTLMPRDQNQLVKDVSGNNLFEEKSSLLLRDVSGHNIFGADSKQTEPIKLLSGPSGHNLTEQKSEALPEPEKPEQEAENNTNNPHQLPDSNVFDLEHTSGTTVPLSGDLTDCEESEREDDHDDDGEQSISADDDQLLIGKTTEDGAQYLELSFEFLDVDLGDKDNEGGNKSSAGSCVSNDTGTSKKERRRGRRKGTKSSDLISMGRDLISMGQNRDPVKDADKTADTVKLEDDEKSTNSAASKEKRRKKHHHIKHRHSGSRKSGDKTKSEVLNNSFKLDDAKNAADEDKQTTASKLNDSKNSMSSKKRSKKDKKKKKSKKSKEGLKPKSTDEHSSGDLVPESVENLDELLNDAVEAELAVVGDIWMGEDGEGSGDQGASKLAELGNKGTNVRTVKLSVSMPGDNELFGKEADNPDQDRGLLEILDIDPWDREGSKYSNKAAMAAMEREPSVCAEKHDFDAFGHQLYPFAMLCAIGASLEAVQLCYDKYPEAMAIKDPNVGTPLHYACAYAGSAEVVEWLIEKKKDHLSEVDLLQRSPFHVACLYSARIEILKVLVTKLPKGLEAKDYESNTTLHVAAEHDAPADVLEFLAKGNPEALSTKRKDGATPIHLALECGVDSNKIKTLLKLNDDTLKIPDDKGQLPIHMCLLGPTVDVKTVKYLSKGYPEGLKTTTKAGETPHGISKRLGLDSSIRSLLKC